MTPVDATPNGASPFEGDPAAMVTASRAVTRDAAGTGATGRDPAATSALPERDSAGGNATGRDAAGAGQQSGAQVRDAAVELWRESEAAGEPLTGAELARRLGRSDSWGRKIVADLVRADAEADKTDQLDPAGTPKPVPWPARAVRIAAMAIVVTAAAVVSFDHHRHVALALGEGWRAWLLPLSIDGMLVVASITAWERHRAQVRVGGWVWAGLTLGIIASITGNIAAAEPTPGAWLIAAWPPLALKLCLAMLLTRTQPRRRRAQREE